MKAVSELAQTKYDELVLEHRTEMKAASVKVESISVQHRTEKESISVQHDTEMRQPWWSSSPCVCSIALR